jgi:hypothetical protein
MAVTKQTYTASATWTAANVADAFEDAFIDAGLMTAWHDSFANGAFENRVLEVEYDGTKTYGTCYYWFIFTIDGVFVSIASGWNTGTNVPSGTAFVDYFATTTNTTTNHFTLIGSLSTATAVEIVRYTSAVNTDYSWFSVRNGSTPVPFTIAPASATLATWIDLDKVLFHHILWGRTGVTSPTNNCGAFVEFLNLFWLRRSFHCGGALRGATAISRFRDVQLSMLTYGMTGNSNNATANWDGLTRSTISTSLSAGTPVLLPYGFNNTNTAYATDYAPVINGYTYSNYTTNSMPADFGLFFNFGTTAFAFSDRIIVSAGVEEWEVYGFANNTSADSASSLIVARVV